MPVFLVALSVAAADEGSWSADAATRQLAEQSSEVEVVRTWATPDPRPDFLVVRARAEIDVENAARLAELPLGSIAAVELEGDATAADIVLIGALPPETPRTLLYLDVMMAFIPKRWAWCDECKDFHALGRHTR